jgi:hypothetical protein
MVIELPWQSMSDSGTDSPSLREKIVILAVLIKYLDDLVGSGSTAYLTPSNASIAARNVIADLADHWRQDGCVLPASTNNYKLPFFDYPLCWVITGRKCIILHGRYRLRKELIIESRQGPGWRVSSSNKCTTRLFSKGIDNTGRYRNYGSSQDRMGPRISILCMCSL